MSQLRIGVLEPHLLRFGGIRRMVEFANGLVQNGHEVTFYLPGEERLACGWMPCRASIVPLQAGYDADLDVLLWNEESQWHLVERFRRARRKVFYALHYGPSYGKPGSWEAMRTPVHRQLANSNWTADRIEESTGHRPSVVLGGINPDHFRPVNVPKRYPLLCVGHDRSWKGMGVMQEAANLVGLPLETYYKKNLPQRELAAEYCAAEIFLVGSEVEGFGQPGLEALACGVPLVTTDNGGCREYASHEETALVVPPGDSQAMANAITRLRKDEALRERLRANGLDLVNRTFRWPLAVERLQKLLIETVASYEELLPLCPNQRADDRTTPVLSIVVLAWDQLGYTQDCVQSIREHTDVPYELIIVDNGSAADARDYARQAADVPILNAENRGFSAGMNQGLAAARGDYVVFLNNDTRLPARWASTLVETLRGRAQAGIVVPAVTAAGNSRTVRSSPGSGIETIRPFEAPPSAVLYAMPRDIAIALEGWGEEYAIASAEDVDLCFKVWVNGLDVVFDERVLVDHVGKGTAGEKLDDWRGLWARNRQVLFDKWTGPSPSVPRIAGCSVEEFERNLAVARSVATWMERYFTARRVVPWTRLEPLLRLARPVVARASRFLFVRRDDARVRRLVSEVKRRPALHRLLKRLK